MTALVRAARGERDPSGQVPDTPKRKRQHRPTDKSNEPSTQDNAQGLTDEDIPELGPNTSSKRPRISSPSFADDTSPDAAADDDLDPIECWRRRGRWPRQYFEPNMEHLLARKKSSSSSSLRRKRSDSDISTAPTDQKRRDEKSAHYRDPRYKTLLATKGSFMDKSEQGITNESSITMRKLLTSDQSIPTESLFRDDLFEQTCRSVEDRNEARILRDISPLIVPSAEILTIYGSDSLKCLIESTNEGWNNSIPLTGTRPQPDYSIGFRLETFTKEQLDKLSPFIGDFIAGDLSYFMATYYMYFPFFACEVKCGAAALDIADRQNAHSMTLAARGIVELFRLVNRQHEVHQQILAFSVSHDHRSVRIYGYYPIISDGETKYYRHPIHTFDFTALDGKERWTAYRFIKSLYYSWMPDHLKRIRAAIDELPSKVDFPGPGLSESTQLSLAASEADSASLLVDDQPDRADQISNPIASFPNPEAAKRRRNAHAP